MVDIQHGSQIAWVNFNEHSDTLLNRHVSLRLRLRLFDSVITPTIVFGLMTCRLTSNQLRKLQMVKPNVCFFFPPHLFGRMKVHWYKAVLLGSFQAQTVFILGIRSIVGWAPLVDNDWHALMKTMYIKFENAQQIFNVRPWTQRWLVGSFRFAAKIVSAINSWASITGEWYPYQRWKMNYCVEPRRRIGRPAGMIKLHLLHRKFSIPHGFRRPKRRHGTLRRQFLYSGAWNADVWL